MKNTTNSILLIFLVVSVLSIIGTPAVAQFNGFGNIWQMPAFLTQPMQVPTWSVNGDILVDNFEYWDSPYNHGWMQQEPSYPVYGFGLGYATIFNTVLDLQEGSRVLDVYRPSSVFLLSTNYERHYIIKFLSTPASATAQQGSQGIDLSENGVLSFKFRAPLGIEPWDIFQLDVSGYAPGANGAIDNPAGGVDDIPFIIQIRPIQPPYNTCGVGGSSTANMGACLATLLQSPALNNSSNIVVRIDIGRNFLDGSWHMIWLDLKKLQDQAYVSAGEATGNDTDGNGVKDAPAAEAIDTAYSISASGQMFRMDDITFRAKDYNNLDQPDFFEIGPLYAQIFEPYRYLFMCDYQVSTNIPQLGTRQMVTNLMLKMDNFILDPDDITDAWVADLLELDPNYYVIDPNHALYDPNYTNRWIPGDPNYGKADPVASLYLRDGFFIDATLPVFTDPNLRIAGSLVSQLQAHGALGWNVTVNSYGANATQAFLVQPLQVNPYDGVPTYIPAYYSGISAVKAYGKAHYGPIQCFALESALWNSGMLLWPNIAYMDYTPQVFEDLILTIEVTDNRRSDVRTIPLSVVNYPVENYPPVPQIYASPKIFYIGQNNEYLIKFIDPDCFIFSLAQFQGLMPATTHLPGWPINDWSQIRDDQDSLFFNMTIDGMPSYQYGPWIQSIIDPHSGLISFDPVFEGRYRAVISATDNRGGVGIEDFPLLCVQQGTWLNHPPFIEGCPTRPVVVKTGEEVMIGSPDFIVSDPDGDQLYASCNIGSCGQLADGGFMWTFQSNFPGTYNVEVIFYDIRGGYAIMKFLLDVKPWWSY